MKHNPTSIGYLLEVEQKRRRIGDKEAAKHLRMSKKRYLGLKEDRISPHKETIEKLSDYLKMRTEHLSARNSLRKISLRRQAKRRFLLSLSLEAPRKTFIEKRSRAFERLKYIDAPFPVNFLPISQLVDSLSQLLREADEVDKQFTNLEDDPKQILRSPKTIRRFGSPVLLLQIGKRNERALSKSNRTSYLYNIAVACLYHGYSIHLIGERIIRIAVYQKRIVEVKIKDDGEEMAEIKQRRRFCGGTESLIKNPNYELKPLMGLLYEHRDKPHIEINITDLKDKLHSMHIDRSQHEIMDLIYQLSAYSYKFTPETGIGNFPLVNITNSVHSGSNIKCTIILADLWNHFPNLPAEVWSAIGAIEGKLNGFFHNPCTGNFDLNAAIEHHNHKCTVNLDQVTKEILRLTDEFTF